MTEGGGAERREVRVNLGAVRARALRFTDTARMVAEDTVAMAAELDGLRQRVEELGVQVAQHRLAYEALTEASRDLLWRTGWMREMYDAVTAPWAEEVAVSQIITPAKPRVASDQVST